MNERNVGRALRAGTIGACVAAALVTTVQGAEPVAAEKGWADVTRCAQESSERARHTCLDRVLRDAGLLTSQMDAQQQRRSFGLDAPAPTVARQAPAAAALPPAAAPPAAQAVPSPPAVAAPAARPVPAPSPAPAPKAADPDKLDVEIASARKGLDGYYLITTTEGAVWRQNESSNMALPPDRGGHMTIRKSALGGYRCSLAQTHVTFRCERNK